MSASWCTPSSSTVRAAATRSVSPSTASSGASRPTWVIHCAGVLEREAAALGERVDHRVEAAGGGAREQAPAGVGDGDVGEPADADVEHGALGLRPPASARTMPKADRSMPSSLRPASRGGGDQLARPSRGGRRRRRRACAAGRRRLDRAERLPVEDRLVHRHRDVVGRLHLDGGGERLLVVERRQVERADDDPLVGDAEPDPVGEPVARRRSAFSASARAGTSATSPSRRTPGRSGATAPRLSDSDPLTVTSAAAMWPGSSSRPTTRPGRRNAS